MKMIKNLCVLTAIFATPSLYAQADNQTQPYGDNPNIFKVLAKKTSDAVQNTAEKVGNATERGIQKIKPTFDSTIENTKNYTTDQATIARDNTRQGIDTAVKKVEQTKERIMGRTNSNVPIEQGKLSQSSTVNQTNYDTSPVAATINNNAPIVSQPVQQIPLNQANPNQVPNNIQEEPEIKKQSLPIENNASQSNSAQNSSTPNNTTISSAKDSTDDDAGVPK